VPRFSVGRTSTSARDLPVAQILTSPRDVDVPRGPLALPYLSAALLLLTACNPRYAAFRLPPPGGPPEPNLSIEWHPAPAPVLGPGAPGAWDSVDVLNPSVLQHGPRLLNFYSGFDGKVWHTGLATSSDDGASWTRAARLLSPANAAAYIAANGSAIESGPGTATIFYYFQSGRLPSIDLAESPDDGATLRLRAPSVLAPGPRGSWDERGVADPYVIRASDGMLYMFYLGQDRARRQRLGVARSPDGLHWIRLLANPILELGSPRAFDENGLGEPAVFPLKGWWWMLYTGRDRAENRRLGLARSPDGVHWTKLDAPLIAGFQPWNSKVVCDPTVLPSPHAGAVRVWFGGGDAPRPDERLNGQIGYGELHFLPAR
jgi:predicted GH43/DUF377 family glycosyl hydrolase